MPIKEHYAFAHAMPLPVYLLREALQARSLLDCATTLTSVQPPLHAGREKDRACKSDALVGHVVNAECTCHEFTHAKIKSLGVTEFFSF